MKTKSEIFSIDGGGCSFSKLTGKTIKDLIGHVSRASTDVPVFKINTIDFTDGSHVWMEGEHDCAYVPSGKLISEEQMESLYREERGE